jgi:hypothetical protein
MSNTRCPLGIHSLYITKLPLEKRFVNPKLLRQRARYLAGCAS